MLLFENSFSRRSSSICWRIERRQRRRLLCTRQESSTLSLSSSLLRALFFCPTALPWMRCFITVVVATAAAFLLCESHVEWKKSYIHNTEKEALLMWGLGVQALTMPLTLRHGQRLPAWKSSPSSTSSSSSFLRSSSPFLKATSWSSSEHSTTPPFRLWTDYLYIDNNYDFEYNNNNNNHNNTTYFDFGMSAGRLPSMNKVPTWQSTFPYLSTSASSSSASTLAAAAKSRRIWSTSSLPKTTPMASTTARATTASSFSSSQIMSTDGLATSAFQDNNRVALSDEITSLLQNSMKLRSSLSLLSTTLFPLLGLALGVAVLSTTWPSSILSSWNNNNQAVPLPDVRYFVAGAVCAATSHGMTVPLDVIKTRMQAGMAVGTQDDSHNHDPTSSASQQQQQQQPSWWDVTCCLLREQGPGGLLVGMGPTVLGYGLEGATKFGLYESLKPYFCTLLLQQLPLPLVDVSCGPGNGTIQLAYLLASIVAGAVGSIVLCPLEQQRIHQVTADKDTKSSTTTSSTATMNIPPRDNSGWFLLAPEQQQQQLQYEYAAANGWSLIAPKQVQQQQQQFVPYDYRPNTATAAGVASQPTATPSKLADGWSGLPALLSKQVPYTIGKQVSFDWIAQSLYAVTATMMTTTTAVAAAAAVSASSSTSAPLSSEGAWWLATPFFTTNMSQLQPAISVVSAFLASIVACVLSHPGDVLLTATTCQPQQHSQNPQPSSPHVDGAHDETSPSSASSPPSSSCIETATRLYQQHGAMGFFTLGLMPRLLHVSVIITTQLALYDAVKQFLGLPATGAV